MNIEIKDIKFSEFASHETLCFEASVYVDGNKSFIVENDGNGGCHNYTKLETAGHNVRQINKQIDRGPEGLDYLINDLLIKALTH
jgi:hypothetical protein